MNWDEEQINLKNYLESREEADAESIHLAKVPIKKVIIWINVCDPKLMFTFNRLSYAHLLTNSNL